MWPLLPACSGNLFSPVLLGSVYVPHLVNNRCLKKPRRHIGRKRSLQYLGGEVVRATAYTVTRCRVESSRVWTFVVDAELAVCRCQQGHYLSRRSTSPSSLVDAPVIPRFTVDRRIPSEFTSHELNSTQIN